MKRFRKLVSLAVIFLLIASIFSGCGTVGTPQSTNASTGTATTKAASAESTPTEATSAEVKEPLELSLWDAAIDTMPIVQNDVISDEIAKITGVKWKSLEGNNGVDANQRFNVMVQSGTVPDVMWVTNTTPNIWNQCKENDLIWALTMDDFTQYAPEIANRLDPVVVAATILPDNTFYGVPSWMPLSEYDKKQNPNFAVATSDWQSWFGDYNTAFVRDDLLKQFFPEAKSFDELYEGTKKAGGLTKEEVLIPGLQTDEDIIAFLKNIKALNLKQDGNSVLPFGADGDFFQAAMANTGGVFGGTWGIDFFNNNTGEYDLFYEKPEYKALLKKWNAAAKDGLLDPNYIVMKSEQKQEKLKRGEYAFVITYQVSGKELNDACESLNRSYRYRPVLIPYKITKNFPGFWGCSANAAAFYMLNKKTIKKEDVPTVLNFFNFYLTPEGADLVSYGPESAGLWTKDAEGKKKFSTKELEDSAVYWNYVDGAKDSSYYGLVDGGPKNAADARHYVFYMAQNNLAIPRLLNWPLPDTGTPDNVYLQVDNIDRKTQQWQIDAIWQGVVNKPEIDKASELYSPARSKVLNEVLPAIIFAKTDADFEKYYKVGLDTFYKEGDYPAFKAAMDNGSKEFLAKHPEVAPIEWPVK